MNQSNCAKLAFRRSSLFSFHDKRSVQTQQGKTAHLIQQTISLFRIVCEKVIVLISKLDETEKRRADDKILIRSLFHRILHILLYQMLIEPNRIESHQLQLHLSLRYAFLLCLQLAFQLLNSILSLISSLQPHFVPLYLLALFFAR